MQLYCLVFFCFLSFDVTHLRLLVVKVGAPQTDVGIRVRFHNNLHDGRRALRGMRCSNTKSYDRCAVSRNRPIKMHHLRSISSYEIRSYAYRKKKRKKKGSRTRVRIASVLRVSVRVGIRIVQGAQHYGHTRITPCSDERSISVYGIIPWLTHDTHPVILTHIYRAAGVRLYVVSCSPPPPPPPHVYITLPRRRWWRAAAAAEWQRL